MFENFNGYVILIWRCSFPGPMTRTVDWIYCEFSAFLRLRRGSGRDVQGERHRDRATDSTPNRSSTRLGKIHNQKYKGTDTFFDLLFRCWIKSLKHQAEVYCNCFFYFRCNLSSVVLQMLAMGIKDVVNFDFMDKPTQQVSIKTNVRSRVFHKVNILHFAVVKHDTSRIKVFLAFCMWILLA